ncbi:MAG TPA: hypothetical protein VML00_06420 [Bacteroidota bacterium]|nr:hypothetical protein [Bacteroidota bacterium]
MAGFRVFGISPVNFREGVHRLFQPRPGLPDDCQPGIRVDVDLRFNSLRYRSLTVITTIESQIPGCEMTYLSHSDDSGVMQPIGTSAALTLNSGFPESVLNGFLSIGVSC